MGCRSNNAVILDGGVPNLGTPAGANQRPWQVFPWRFSSTIEIFVYKNSVIANNRFNDDTSEKFEMPNYKIRRRNTQTWLTLGQRTVGTGWRADFDYNAHYGISFNHATYHRGQISLKLREAGFAPKATDFIMFCRVQPQGN